MPRRSTLRLNKRIVDRLTVDNKDAVFWDRDLAGFGVRVHATGRKVYVVQSRGPAGLKRVTLGPCEGETIEERRREAAFVIDRIKQGEDPMPPEPAPGCTRLPSGRARAGAPGNRDVAPQGGCACPPRGVAANVVTVV